MPRFINESLYRPEVFLSNVSIWDWQINGYQLVMIIWNIFLAVVAVYITYWLVRYLRQKNKKPVAIFFLCLFWFFMVPNTTYLLTDARHIIGYCPVASFGNVCVENAWMVLFFFTFAAMGWVACVWSIRPLRLFITKMYGQGWGIIFIIFIIPIISLGVLLGLLNRWNSWEIVTSPGHILSSSLIYVSDLTYFKNWLIMSILLYLLYFTGEKLFLKLKWEK
jgi:uncharacterized membrane protein